MAGGGGGDSNLSTSILETQTYVIALVLLFFLVTSLSFEHGLRALQQWLRKKGREGLVMAVEKMVMEITLLGLVSLILLLFQQYVPDICMTYSDKDISWTLLNNTGGCPCCMSHTAGITTCAQMYHDCAFNVTDKAPYCGCSLGWPESTPKYTFNDLEDPELNVNLSVPGGECLAYGQNEVIFIFEQFMDSFAAVTTELNTSVAEWCDILIEDEATLNLNSTSNSTAVALMNPTTGRRRLMGESSSPDAASRTLHIIPEVKTFQCEGPFYASSCGVGKHPAISNTALNQIHLLVFLIAAFHIVSAIVVMLVATLRMRQWRRWQDDTFDRDIVERSMSALNKFRASLRRTRLRADGPTPNVSARETRDDIERTADDTISNNKSPGAAEEFLEEQGTAQCDVYDPVSNPSEVRDSNKASEFGAAAVAAVSNAATSVQRQWVRRDSQIQRKRHWIAEAVVCVGKALFPNLVSREEFNMMRQAYIVSKPDLPADYDFVKDLQLHLDFDFVHILGASLTMWICLLFMWLLSGLIPWIPALLLLFAVLGLFAIDIGLVAVVRHQCRGGRPHRVRATDGWSRNRRLLSIPLGGIIFMCSSVFSTNLFFAWQFGSESCFFRRGQSMWKFVPYELPWWTAMIGAAIMLFWLASITVPAWALVVHMRPSVEDAECGDRSGHGKLGVSRKGRTQAMVLEELKCLQEELEFMQKE